MKKRGNYTVFGQLSNSLVAKYKEKKSETITLGEIDSSLLEKGFTLFAVVDIPVTCRKRYLRLYIKKK